MVPAPEALLRLRDGNARFVAAGDSDCEPDRKPRNPILPTDQAPFAIILGCSDSRVPAEIVFDQGLGDLFVIRVAGNIVAPSQVGSVEFAVEHYSTRLVVVLGHSECGAVIAALEEPPAASEGHSPNILSIVDRIRASLAPLIQDERQQDPMKLLQSAVRANICASANSLRHGSEMLERLTANDEVVIVGAEYSLASGIVEFFDGIPDTT